MLLNLLILITYLLICSIWQGTPCSLSVRGGRALQRTFKHSLIIDFSPNVLFLCHVTTPAICAATSVCGSPSQDRSDPSTQAPAPQATVLTLLQAKQVLQVNQSGATVSGVSALQNTNNQSVVVLQQGNACLSQATVREELPNQMSCQHIDIIQTPNQAAPAQQNPQVGNFPAALPTAVSALLTQNTTTNCKTTTANLHMVGRKQLVHILPRPFPPKMKPS